MKSIERIALAVIAVGAVCAGGSGCTEIAVVEDASIDSGDPARPDTGGPCRDADGDGHFDAACGGDDCDDTNPNRFPSNPEVCDSASIDEDCNPTTFAGPSDGDADGDGSVAETCCNLIAGSMRCGGDCDDENPAANPTAPDTCGGGDQDCDGDIDENPDDTFYRDVDGDGYGAGDDTVLACSAPSGYAVLGGDCDDAQGALNPGEDEVCEGSVDENCNGSVDEACPCSPVGATESCGPATEAGACRLGMRECFGEGWGPCVGDINPTAEQCNGGSTDDDDEDCDGTIDEAEACECTNGESRYCRAAGATAFGFPSICNEVIQVCDNGRWPRDCSAESLTAPMTEVCEGSLDQDCDGTVDEPPCGCINGHMRACSTNTGECSVGTQMCNSGNWSSCSGTLPATETCDHLDNDCDGFPDDGVNTTCSWSDTTLLSEEFTCLPGSSCASWAFGNALQLGHHLAVPCYPACASEAARIAYLPTPVDWGRLQFTTSATISVRKWASTNIGHGVFGVLLSPRNTRGSESASGMPQLSPGQTGWAAVYENVSGLLRIYELRPDADPIARATASSALTCTVGTSERDYTIELEYGLGTLTAAVSATGCAYRSVSHTLTATQIDALIGNTPSYPRYYPGVFGNDLSGGTILLLERFAVDRSWGCQGCPW